MTYASMPAAPSPLIYAWAAAIYTREGNKPGDLSTRQNNPGNIRDAQGNFLSFATMPDGWQYLYGDLAAKISLYPGYTFQQIMSCADGVTHCYAPGSGDYGSFVASQINQILGTNFTGSTTLAQASASAAGISDGSGMAPDAGSTDATAPDTAMVSDTDNSTVWAILAAVALAWAVL